MKQIFFITCMLMLGFSFGKKWDAVYINKLIAKGDIDKVIQHYEEKYYSTNRDPQDAFRIADLYIKKKDYATAMKWYDKENQLIYSSKVNLFNYARANQLTGNYQKALDGYLLYIAQTGDINKAMDEVKQCEKVLNASAQADNYKLDNYTYNSDKDEIGIAVLRNNPIYIIKDKNGENNTNEIYQIVRDYDKFAEPIKAIQKNTKNLFISDLSYTQDGNSVVFSAKETPSNSKNGHEKLYFAENLGGKLLNIRPYPNNKEGVDFKHPSFNADGTIIYFYANMQGGNGKNDIWETKLENGKWTSPSNLGNLLNTNANEINPFIVQDGKENTLYFASDRDGGFGGYDIYKAIQQNGVWEGVEMQPAPINSAGDDIAIIYDDKVKTGYFISDREGGKGGFDVYRFIPFNLKLIVNTTDSASHQAINYALVQVIENGKVLAEGMSDNNGQAIFQLGKNKKLSIKISKDNYKSITTTATTLNKISGDSVVLQVPLIQDDKFAIKNNATNTISMDNYIVFTGRVIDAYNNKPAKATMRMMNYTTNKMRELDLDEDGRFEIKLFLNNNYKIVLQTANNKLTDELTTLGLERNTVKVRDYLLKGNQLTLTENRVYRADNLPASIKLSTELKPTSNIINNTTEQQVINQPITQAKIDSLIKIISKEFPNNKTALANKTIPVQQEESKVTNVASPPITAATKVAIIEVAQEPKIKTDTAVPIQKEIKVEEEKASEMQEALQTKVETTTPKIQAQIDTLSVPKKMSSTSKTTASILEKEDKEALVANLTNAQEVQKVKKRSKTNKSSKDDELDETKVEQIVVPTIPIDKPSSKIDTMQIALTQETKKEIVEPAELTISPSKAPAAETTLPTSSSEKIVTQSNLPTTTPTVETLPEVYYKIQLDSYEIPNIKFPEFEHLGKIEEVNAYGRYIYRLGNFEDLERAKEVLELVRSQGYFVAFILQYNKNKITGIIN